MLLFSVKALRKGNRPCGSDDFLLAPQRRGKIVAPVNRKIPKAVSFAVLEPVFGIKTLNRNRRFLIGRHYLRRNPEISDRFFDSHTNFLRFHSLIGV